MASEAAVVEALAILADVPPAHPMVLDHDETLHMAAESNDVDGLRRAIAEGGADLDLDALDSQLQYTPAIHAAGNDCVESLVLLEDAGADLDKRGRNGMTCAFSSAVKGSVRALAVLIEAGVDVDAEYNDETALEWLGLPCETGSLYGSRLHGDRLMAAKMLVLAGAYVETGVIVHRPSRDLLHAWARSELVAAAAFHAFLMGLNRGMSAAHTPCPLGTVNLDGLPQRVASFLVRRAPAELRRLARAAWVWQDEADDEAYRAEVHAFPRQGFCIDVF